MTQKRKPDDQILKNRSCRFSDADWEPIEDIACQMGVSTPEFIRWSTATMTMLMAIFVEYKSFSKAFEIVSAASKSVDTRNPLQRQIQAQIQADREKRQ